VHGVRFSVAQLIIGNANVLRLREFLPRAIDECRIEDVRPRRACGG
jgi:hypothetical protein